MAQASRLCSLPKAAPKRHPDLNCAYAFSVSPSLPVVLGELKDALENNGFTPAEADRIVVPGPQGAMPFGFPGRTVRFEPGKEIDAAVANTQALWLNGKVDINTTEGEIRVFAPLDPVETERLVSCVLSAKAMAQVAETARLVAEDEQALKIGPLTHIPSPYELRLDFIVPRLGVSENGQLFDFESTLLLEHPWNLSSKDASLSENYSPLVRPVVETGKVDVSQEGRVQTSLWREPRAAYDAGAYQVPLPISPGQLTIEWLVAWLDRQIEHQDIPEGESSAFLHKALLGLMAKFGVGIEVLISDRHRLREEIETRIRQHRESERKAAFQQFLGRIHHW